MLRITTHETGSTVHLQLEGSLTGPWVAELEHEYVASRSRNEGRLMVVDVRDVWQFDAAARYLLALLRRDGAAIDCDLPFEQPFELRGCARNRGARL